MKNLFKTFALIFAFLFVLTGCISEEPKTTVSTETAQTQTEEINYFPDGIVRFVKDGAPAVRLVTTNMAHDFAVVAKDLLIDFSKYLKEETELSFDKYRDNKKVEEEKKDMVEIVFGLTTREESVAAHKDIAYDEYSVTVSGNKILLSAYTEENLEKAYKKFLTSVKKSKSEEGELCFKTEDVFSSHEDSMAGALPVYESGICAGVYKAGENVDLVLTRKTTEESFLEYLDTLENEGFTEYTRREVADNVFAIYKNDKYTVNAGFYAYEKSARVLIEPKGLDVDLEEDDKDHKKICEPMITMLGLATVNSSGDSDNNNGLSLLIRLEDGRFIVVDGGHASPENANNLLYEMRRQSADYASKDSEIEIAAWVTTHMHSDHMGMLSHYMGYFDGVKIDRVMMNIIYRPYLDEAKASSEYGANFDKTEGTGDTGLVSRLNAKNIPVQRVHMGQMFHIGGAKMEFLYTLDGYTPRLLNAVNTTSLVIRFEIGGQTIIIPGDATGDAMQICADMYGDYLKCDIASVAHHGYSTWGNDSGVVNAYNFMRPEVVLWCQGSSSYPYYSALAYNKVLFEFEEFKEVFVAGEQGEYSRLPLPYTPKASESDKAA